MENWQKYISLRESYQNLIFDEIKNWCMFENIRFTHFTMTNELEITTLYIEKNENESITVTFRENDKTYILSCESRALKTQKGVIKHLKKYF
jgi:hypothetical protein